MSLYDFLQSHRAVQNERFTHTGLIPMIGKYFIPPERLDVFYRLYNKSLKKKQSGERNTISEFYKIWIFQVFD